MEQSVQDQREQCEQPETQRGEDRRVGSPAFPSLFDLGALLLLSKLFGLSSFGSPLIARGVSVGSVCVAVAIGYGDRVRTALYCLLHL